MCFCFPARCMRKENKMPKAKGKRIYGFTKKMLSSVLALHIKNIAHLVFRVHFHHNFRTFASSGQPFSNQPEDLDQIQLFVPPRGLDQGNFLTFKKITSKLASTTFFCSIYLFKEILGAPDTPPSLRKCWALFSGHNKAQLPQKGHF